MQVQALTSLPVDMSISTASKHTEDGVVWLALLDDLERSSVRGKADKGSMFKMRFTVQSASGQNNLGSLDSLC
jgi:hypothetical protein